MNSRSITRPLVPLALGLLMIILSGECHAEAGDPLSDLRGHSVRAEAEAACKAMVKEDCCTHMKNWTLSGRSSGAAGTVFIGYGGFKIEGDLVLETIHAIGRYTDAESLGPCSGYQEAKNRARIPGGNWYRRGCYVKGEGSYNIAVSGVQVKASYYTFYDESIEDSHIACKCGPCCKGCKKKT